MSTKASKFCLDANVLIQAWQKYYNPKFCPDYWKILIELGKQEIIFIPELVYEEITRTEDELSKWLKASKIPIEKISESVTICLQKIYAADPEHKKLVDNIRGRSLADPWVIAHAMDKNAIVVTKENKETALNSKRIKIPNVCENMGIKWIDDFQLIERLDIKFSCTLS
jgi:predicted nucleic acid-binding protein